MQQPYNAPDGEPAHEHTTSSSASSDGGVPALFDASFQSFVTPSVASVLFVIALIGGALAAVAAVVAGEFAGEPLTRAYLAVPGYLLWLLLVRMLLEAAVVLFRIEEHLRVLTLRDR